MKSRRQMQQSTDIQESVATHVQTGLAIGIFFIVTIGISSWLFNASNQILVPTLHLTDQELAWDLQRAKKLTVAVKKGLEDHRAKPTDETRSLLIRLAEQRNAILSRVAERDVQRFRSIATLTDTPLDGAPEFIASLVEKRVTLSGVITTPHIDTDESGTLPSSTTPILETIENGVFTLIPESSDIPIEPADQTTLSGIQFQNTNGELSLFVEGDIAAEEAIAPLTPASPARTLILLVVFCEFAPTPCGSTTGLVPPNHSLAGTTIYMNSVASYYQENSYGQYDLSTFDIYPSSGYIVIPYATPTTLTTGIAAGLWNDVFIAAEAQFPQIDFTTYSQFAFIHNKFRSDNRVGYSKSIGPTTLGTPDGNVRAGVSYINYFLSTYSLGHEIGHNLDPGLDHAKAYGCKESIPPTHASCWQRVIDAPTCSNIDYGGQWDIMAGSVFHMNAPHKEYVGWLPQSHVKIANSTGTYTLSPIGRLGSDGSIEMLKIPKLYNPSPPYEVWRWYYVELRRALPGADATLPVGVRDSLVIHYNNYPDTIIATQLLDFHPRATQFSCSAALNSGDFIDAPLRINETHSDPTVSGLQISPLGLDANNNMRVKVELPDSHGCNFLAPGIEVLTPQGSGEIGTEQQYTVRVTNRDTGKCDPSKYLVRAALPSTWTTTLGGGQLNQGASGDFSFRVTPLNKDRLTNGNHTIRVFIDHLSAQELQTTVQSQASVIYTLSNPPPPPNIEIPQ